MQKVQPLKIVLKVEKVAALIAATFIFYPTFSALYMRWLEPVSFYDHAILVPFVSIWMAWRTYTANPGSTQKSTHRYPALFFIFSALFLHLLGASQQITVLQGAALVLWIWSSVIWLGGVEGFKRYRWALLYLLLLIPIPSFFMSQLTYGMRELSATLAGWTLHGIMAILGLPYSRVGNVLHFAQHKVTIVDACSGMNTLITVIAIGWVLIYMETSRVKSWVIAFLLVPTAILTNLMRILAICAFVAAGWGEFAFGAGHSGIGIVTVGASLLFLALGVRIPLKWDQPTKKSEKIEAIESSSPEPQVGHSRSRTLVFLGVLIFFAILSIQIRRQADFVAVSQETDTTAQFNIPGWKTTELKVDATTFDVVGTRDARMFRFESLLSTAPVFLYRVHSPDSRKIGHPPELCYRAEHYEILARTPTTLQVNGRTLPIVQMIVRRGNYALLVYYWYRMGGVETSSYLEHQLRWSWNQIKKLAFVAAPTDGTMIRVATEIRTNSPVERSFLDAKKRLESWISDQDRLNNSSL